MYKLLLIFLFSFTFTQEPCEGTCLSEEETQGLFNNIKELQFDLDNSLKINSNFELQITDYDKSILNYQDQVKLCNEQIKIKEDMIKTIKPKWYHNRYLWFGFGVFFTSGTVYLAGQLD